MAEGNPINEIIQMRQQGISNNQIIQNMQRNGYSNTQIFDAMNQVDTKVAVEGLQPVTNYPPSSQPGQDLFSQPPMGQQQSFSPTSQNSDSSSQVFSDDTAQTMQFDSSSSSDSFQTTNVAQEQPRETVHDIFQDNQVKIEELVETIIEEKWEELLRDVNKIINWKNKVESRVSEIEMRLDHLKESFSDLQKAIVGKVGEYDKHIMEVGSEIKAMERVFSKVLPTFTENVNELTNITRKIKEGEKR